ncbi:MAG TPA: hypothetical protein VLE73_05630 [Candidatus Saccharimonadales bacterium]|nr:hypothetical protein [Candidatus Saccharimonadales bacterium]
MTDAEYIESDSEAYVFRYLAEHEKLGFIGTVALSVHMDDFLRLMYSFGVTGNIMAFDTEAARKVCTIIHDEWGNDDEDYTVRRSVARIGDGASSVQLHSDELGMDVVEAAAAVSARELYERCDPRYYPVLFKLSVYTDAQRARYEQEKGQTPRSVGHILFSGLVEPPSLA